MTGENETTAAGWGSPALNYLALCGAGLGVTLLVLLSKGHSALVCLLIVLVGVAGVLTRMSLAPLTVLLLVAVSQLAQQLHWADFRWRWQMPTRGTLVVSDILLGAAVLAYVVGHYRLQGLSRHIFPPDPRLRMLYRFTQPPGKRGALPAIERQRAVHLVTPVELAVLVVSLPLWALAAQLVWHFLAQSHDILARQYDVEEWSPGLTRLIVLLTVLTGSTMMVAGLLRHVRRRRLTVDEARLLLQDTLWNETRGEQRWFTRWLAWFRLDQKERKEQP